MMMISALEGYLIELVVLDVKVRMKPVSRVYLSFYALHGGYPLIAQMNYANQCDHFDMQLDIVWTRIF